MIANNNAKLQASFEEILSSGDKAFKDVIASAKDRNIQIVYTQINRDSKNNPSFTTASFNLNDSNYFYPASTVKMPTAFIALEKINSLKNKGIDKHTPMVTDSSSNKQMAILNDPLTKNGAPTIAEYVKQIFLVSDNQAYNRLYEFIGQTELNEALAKKGFRNIALRHRLESPLSVEQNRYTNPISFLDTAGNIIYQQAEQYSNYTFQNNNAKLGKGYMKAGKLINQPFDFAEKNRLPLAELHKIIQTIIFPESVNKKQRFNLSEDDYKMVYKYMHLSPIKSDYPNYQTPDYYDNYCKFLLAGADKTPLPDGVFIFNKVGDAYGFLIDAAYIIDTKNNVEFILSAAISCNSDGIYNDDKYEYESIGYPFMKKLGELVYQYELKRPKAFKANFSKLFAE